MSEKFVMINNARVSFPHLFTPPTINGEEGSCGAVLLIEDSNPAIAALNAEISRVTVEKHKGRKLPSDKLCLRLGEDRRPEYAGYWALSANCKKGKVPIVVANNGTGVVRSDTESSIYPGCRVNAKVRVWGQDNNFGKRINAELVAIQFAGDDEPLDDSYVSPEEAMSGFGGAPSGAVGADPFAA